MNSEPGLRSVVVGDCNIKDKLQLAFLKTTSVMTSRW